MCLFVRARVPLFVSVCLRVSVSVCPCLSLPLQTYTYIYIYVCVCITYIYVCIMCFICTYVCICTYGLQPCHAAEASLWVWTRRPGHGRFLLFSWLSRNLTHEALIFFEFLAFQSPRRMRPQDPRSRCRLSTQLIATFEVQCSSYDSATSPGQLPGSFGGNGGSCLRSKSSRSFTWHLSRARDCQTRQVGREARHARGWWPEKLTVPSCHHPALFAIAKLQTVHNLIAYRDVCYVTSALN